MRRSTVKNHRQAFREGQSVTAGRSHMFTRYLETLPPAEKRRIQAAELAYLNKVNAPSSPQRALLQDYGDSMLGISE